MVRRPKKSTMEEATGTPKSSYSGKKGSGSSRGVSSWQTTISNFGRVTTPIGKLKTFTDRTFASYAWQDPFGTNAPGLINHIYTDAVLHGIWTGGTASASETALIDYLNDMITQLHARAAETGYSITSFSTATLAASWLSYCNAYVNLYGRLRGAQSLLSLYGYNNACNRVVMALLNRKPDLDARIARLEGYPMPQRLRDSIDHIMGTWIPSDAGTAPMFNIVDLSGNKDFGSDADWTTWFTNTDVQFGNLNANPQDFGNIMRVLGYLYGPPGRFGDKRYIQSDQEYCMQLSQGMTFFDGVANNYWAGPTADNTAVPGMIPMYVYGNADALDPLWTSLCRPTMYYIGNGGNLASIGPRGVFTLQPSGANGSTVNWYISQSGLHSVYSNSDVASVNIGIDNITDYAYPWQSVVDQKTATVSQVSTDFRLLQGYERYYLGRTDILDNHRRWLEWVFFGSIVGPRRF